MEWISRIKTHAMDKKGVYAVSVTPQIKKKIASVYQ